VNTGEDNFERRPGLSWIGDGFVDGGGCVLTGGGRMNELRREGGDEELRRGVLPRDDC
jgi:hypothetical protein